MAGEEDLAFIVDYGDEGVIVAEVQFQGFEDFLLQGVFLVWFTQHAVGVG